LCRFVFEGVARGAERVIDAANPDGAALSRFEHDAISLAKRFDGDPQWRRRNTFIVCVIKFDGSDEDPS